MSIGRQDVLIWFSGTSGMKKNVIKADKMHNPLPIQNGPESCLGPGGNRSLRHRNAVNDARSVIWRNEKDICAPNLHDSGKGPSASKGSDFADRGYAAVEDTTEGGR